ncbi:MAG: DUF3631 domain-containing protein [Xanthobacteraceae bacterium]
MAPDLIDESTIRTFLELLHSRAAAALSHERRPGVLQLVSISPDDSGMSISPFAIGDVDHMVEAAITDARAGRNAYTETRSVRPGRPHERGRGKIESTIGVFAFVIDNDADRGKAGHVNGDASAVIETSPGNSHVWLFLDHALGAADAKPLGDMIRKASGADHATGVITQPYRLPGTPNYPDAKKRARGRIVGPTKLLAVTNKLWTPGEIEAAFSTDAAQVAKPAGSSKTNGRHPTTPRSSAAVKRRLSRKANPEMDRSAQFQSAVNAAVRAGVSPNDLEAEMRKHPDGCASKYLESGDRLRAEINRSYAKVEQQQQQEQAQRDAEHAERAAAGKGIGGAELLDEIYEFLGRFIAYPSKEARAAHCLWLAHTWMMQCWETTPRLAFLSPEPASGKTRCLEISELLVPSPILAVNVTPAYLVRKIAGEEGVTILFDEVDTVFNNGSRTKEGTEDVRALLNGGYRRGAIVGRCYMQGSVAMTEELPSFAPVALAGLGTLPDTIKSRSIIIRMQRRAPDERVTPYRRRYHADEGQQLCGKLAAWAAAVADKIAIPDMPDEVADRDADCWEALVAIADAAGGHWPDTARCCAVALVALLREEGEERLGVRLLADMRTVLADDEQAATSAILDKLHKLDESPWADIRGKPLNDRGLAVRLRPYGIKPHVIRVGSATPRGYRRADFANAWARYLPPPTPG